MSHPVPTAGQYNSPAFQSFLGQHQALAGLKTQAAVNTFLDGHPEIAKAYARLLTPAAPAASATTPTAEAGATTTAAPTTAQQSAKAVIQGTLDAYGLGALGDWAWGEYLNGTPESKIMLDLQQRPEYKTRFAGLDALRAKGRVISEDQYIAQERSYAQTLRAYGLPASFYDSPDDFSALIAGEVSPQEFDDRLQMGAQVIASDPRGQQLRTELGRLYGLSNADGLALAYWIDPAKGADVIKKQFLAAQVAAQATATGFGSLTTSQAETLGQSGVTADQARNTFSQLAALKPLETGLIGDAGSSAISQQDMLDAAFTGSSAAQQKLKREQERRVAQFDGGGSYAAGQGGVSGLGSASR